ncbi:hypothetical protein OF83DRAFT_1176114 [Amylostereum chailletii]|nr:hypothetical protein OF83DRAFT_1176114 [Amylostereum chailletii]
MPNAVLSPCSRPRQLSSSSTQLHRHQHPQHRHCRYCQHWRRRHLLLTPLSPRHSQHPRPRRFNGHVTAESSTLLSRSPSTPTPIALHTHTLVTPPTPMRPSPPTSTCVAPSADGFVTSNANAHVANASNVNAHVANALISPQRPRHQHPHHSPMPTPILECLAVSAAAVSKKISVEPKVELPGVGEGYQDHNVCFVPYQAADYADMLDFILCNKPEVMERALASSEWKKNEHPRHPPTPTRLSPATPTRIAPSTDSLIVPNANVLITTTAMPVIPSPAPTASSRPSTSMPLPCISIIPTLVAPLPPTLAASSSSILVALLSSSEPSIRIC